jgi:hypothetical protein
MGKDFKIEVRGEEESAQEFVKAWQRAEAGEPVEEPVERLYLSRPRRTPAGADAAPARSAQGAPRGRAGERSCPCEKTVAGLPTTMCRHWNG